jgi:hypothetical protein
VRLFCTAHLVLNALVDDLGALFELLHKLGPEYSKSMDGLEQVDPKSSEAKEFMSILSELDKRCTE